MEGAASRAAGENAELRWGIGCKEAYPPWRAIKRDARFLRGKHPFIVAGDHANITYVQVQAKRPATLGTASQDRLNRWCLDWSHEDFKIYTVPGEQNFFNDFHSRGGAPGAAPFYTLEEHARRVEEDLERIQRACGEEQPPSSAKTVQQRLAV